MGGAFVSKESVRVKADDDSGEWIDVKPKLSVGDREKILNRSYRGMGKKQTITVGTATTAIMETGFVDWFLKDNNGNAVPFSKANIQYLDPDYPLIDKAIDMIGELNPTLSGQTEMNGSENSESDTD